MDKPVCRIGLGGGAGEVETSGVALADAPFVVCTALDVELPAAVLAL
jgi:hypothetical protein